MEKLYLWHLSFWKYLDREFWIFDIQVFCILDGKIDYMTLAIFQIFGWKIQITDSWVVENICNLFLFSKYLEEKFDFASRGFENIWMENKNVWNLIFWTYLDENPSFLALKVFKSFGIQNILSESLNVWVIRMGIQISDFLYAFENTWMEKLIFWISNFWTCLERKRAFLKLELVNLVGKIQMSDIRAEFKKYLDGKLKFLTFWLVL